MLLIWCFPKHNFKTHMNSCLFLMVGKNCRTLRYLWLVYKVRFFVRVSLTSSYGAVTGIVSYQLLPRAGWIVGRIRVTSIFFVFIFSLGRLTVTHKGRSSDITCIVRTRSAVNHQCQTYSCEWNLYILCAAPC